MSQHVPFSVDIVYRSERTLITRMHVNQTYAIRKETMGQHALQRIHHERAILEILAHVEGVVRAAPAQAWENSLVLEYVRGFSLAEALATRRLGLRELIVLAERIAHILAEVHRADVIHGDLTPANILLADEGRRPILIDFDRAAAPSREAESFTREYAMSSSLMYIAPEQTGRTGRSIDQRSDLYTLGATLYEALTGRPPFKAEEPLALIHDHLASMPRSPSELVPGIPSGLCAIVLRLLEKEPERRYQSAEGLAHDLAALREAMERGEESLPLLGKNDFPPRLSPPARLVARETEIASLRSAFESALHGQCRGVFITGPPGAGKSSLMHELRRMLVAEHAWCAVGKCDPCRTDVASGALFQAFRTLGRLLLTEPEAKLVERRSAVLEALGSNAGLIAALIPELSVFLGNVPQTELTDPVQAQMRLRIAFLSLLRSIASREKPMALMLDDLQWADPITLGLIEEILADEPLAGFLLVGAYREPQMPPMRAWENITIRVDNFSCESLSVFLAEMLRLSPAQTQDLARAVQPHTHGNPYDTVELINALRDDGALRLENDGWHWDESAIRGSIGKRKIAALSTLRISTLPRRARTLLSIAACIGGAVELQLLEAASGLSSRSVRARLSLLCKAGLVTIECGNAAAEQPEAFVRFSHDRIHQTAYDLLGPTSRRERLHLSIARRLAAHPRFAAQTAVQYLRALELVRKPGEQMRAIRLLRAAASKACREADYASAEPFLEAAVKLSEKRGVADDDPERIALENQRHTVFYGLGRYDEGDPCYAYLERRISDPVVLAGAACRQLNSFWNRKRFTEMLALGIHMLRQLGREPVFGTAYLNVDAEIDVFRAWLRTLDLQRELARPEPRAASDLAALEIMGRLMTITLHSDPTFMHWIAFESRRLWVLHGPCRQLIEALCTAPLTFITERGDFRTAYDIFRLAIDIGEARGYEPATSHVRIPFSIMGAPWVEPFEQCLLHSRRAHEELMRCGDIEKATHALTGACYSLMDCGPLETCRAEFDTALALTARTNDQLFYATLLPGRQLTRCLLGEILTPESFNDASFDEERFIAENEHCAPGVVMALYLWRATAAAIFGDREALLRYVAGLRSLLALIPAARCVSCIAITGRLVSALALAERIRDAEPKLRDALLAEFDRIQAWFKLRAIDAPENYAHLASFVEAERAWALDDTWEALRAFDAARREAGRYKRPWHRALITERAGRCCFEKGLTYAGESLILESYRLYEDWGARGKTCHMENTYPFLARELPATRFRGSRRSRLGGSFSSGAIDLLAILRASQALSSETDLDRLRDSVVAILGKMTGATNVFLAPISPRDSPDHSLETAAAQGLLPASVVRYALRNRTPLLIADAPRDERFADDPYFAGLAQCSLLVLPVLDRGALLAVLFLENRLSSAAFSEEHLDTVNLIAGQLAVSLHNTLLYASLTQAYEREKRVAVTFQEAALDPSLPCIPGLALDAVYRPGSAETLVGGDWYDAFRLPDGRIVLSIGDVSGSGLHAAVTMGSVRQSIRTAALINPDPLAVLDAVDRIVRASKRDTFVTAFVGVLDPLFLEFRYANAGHPPPLLKKRDGSMLFLRQEEPPLGLRWHDMGSNASITLEAGSLLILYTDGLTEFEHDPLLGEKQLFDTVRDIVCAPRCASELYQAFFRNRAQRDDVAILTVSLDRPLIDMRGERLVITWEFDANDADVAHAKHRSFLEILEDAGFTRAEISSSALIFGELLGNVVRYAGGAVTIVLDMSAEAPVLHVLDRGKGFEHNRRLPNDLMAENGRGLFLVNAFAEEANVSRRRGGGSHARAVLPGRIRRQDPPRAAQRVPAGSLTSQEIKQQLGSL